MIFNPPLVMPPNHPMPYNFFYVVLNPNEHYNKKNCVQNLQPGGEGSARHLGQTPGLFLLNIFAGLKFRMLDHLKNYSFVQKKCTIKSQVSRGCFASLNPNETKQLQANNL